jgi:hypothetical protein
VTGREAASWVVGVAGAEGGGRWSVPRRARCTAHAAMMAGWGYQRPVRGGRADLEPGAVPSALLRRRA